MDKSSDLKPYDFEPAALIFCMKCHLVNLYQDDQIMPIGPKMARPGVTCFTWVYIGKT